MIDSNVKVNRLRRLGVVGSNTNLDGFYSIAGVGIRITIVCVYVNHFFDRSLLQEGKKLDFVVRVQSAKGIPKRYKVSPANFFQLLRLLFQITLIFYV